MSWYLTSNTLTVVIPYSLGYCSDKDSELTEEEHEIVTNWILEELENNTDLDPGLFTSRPSIKFTDGSIKISVGILPVIDPKCIADEWVDILTQAIPVGETKLLFTNGLEEGLNG